MSKGKIFISTSSFAKFSEEPLNLLKDAGYEVALNPQGRKLQIDESIQLVKGCIGLIAGTEKLNDEVLSALPDLKVISRCGAGMDGVDQGSAKAKGIVVRNTPNAPTVAVAELTVALILSLIRDIALMDKEMKSGQWQKRMGNLLHGKHVGIIGYGRIGKKVAEYLNVFGCELAYYDTYHQSDVFNLPKMELPELMRWADIITIHISSSECMIGAHELELFGSKGCVINTSRGGVIDEKALFDCLKMKKIKAAAIDVFEQEPYDGPLKDLDNVILSPHIGSYAKEARIRMEVESVQNLLDALEGDQSD